ncbi:DJ-1/PfpI family protein [Cryptosporangium sp. NPDC048952]|uniref:DJ-1/PfpI family protein n=1 Tax=Cryptosporangium sp. NPDC048952 TaxID=3363961 RepID=UPI00371D5EA0
MQFAILLYPKVTALDAVGPYDVFSKYPGNEVVFVGEKTGVVRTEIGSLGLAVDATLAEITSPDVLVVPGGHGQAVQLGIEYDPQPPYDAGSPTKAPADVVDYLRQNSRFVLTGKS